MSDTSSDAVFSATIVPSATVIVPTFNERDNIAELVSRVADAMDGREVELLFVDDSTDDTADVIRGIARSASIPVRVLHRDDAVGGLGGAVVEGIRAAAHDVCIVMDGDLQHPPELLPDLVERHQEGDADVVIASRYIGGGDNGGLAGAMRVAVSRSATTLTKAMFPIRLSGASDPMTGYFLVDRRRIDPAALRPNGFKILLEILVRSDVRIAEVPMEFGERLHGESKASFAQGMAFLKHLARLRFGKMSLFAIIGGVGALANLAIMWALTHLGMEYIWAAVIAAEVTIIGNFILQERYVFNDMRDEASSIGVRFAQSFTFNNVEAALRIPILALMVETWHISSILAAAISLVVAFFVRFVFHSLVVYAPRRSVRAGRRVERAMVDAEAAAE
ncbi:glycosyltransferase family 2 protein [Microbacterium capsulatum]|uniref:Glycosyltransferase family 2 protein n=1 Tax=Microbacterium capsulatum TaxID=3041921 RepID=A0ABU0XJA9_9MICO|nr:glycosyltransferase family 2 protein [Microbacterium sp. ASV81]MDQ4215231.1 glycosyltransferase family 2 protein [Microbacterium sp. ASV81]